jgi:hypothetical protein
MLGDCIGRACNIDIVAEQTFGIYDMQQLHQGTAVAEEYFQRDAGLIGKVFGTPEK